MQKPLKATLSTKTIMEDLKPDLRLGQILYDEELQEYKINKIGIKYFYCEGFNYGFDKKTLRTEKAFNNFRLFTELKPIIERKEREALEKVIRAQLNPYGGSNLSIEQLREIGAIITDKRDNRGLLTDDCDMRDTLLDMYVGGNGDYYIELKETRSSEVTRLSTRIAMSGGIANSKTKSAVAALYRALKEQEPNK